MATLVQPVIPDDPRAISPDNPLQVRELNHVAIYVRDLNVSLHFYSEILGLPIVKRPAFGFPGAWIGLGSQELHLIVDTEHLEDPRHSVHIAFLVQDATAAHAELLRRGIPVHSGPGFRPDGYVQVFFHDPDGYLLEMTSQR